MNEAMLKVLPLLFLTLSVRSQEHDLINQLNNFCSFDHNIFLLDSSIDQDRFADLLHLTAKHQHVTPQSVYIYKKVSSSSSRQASSSTKVTSDKIVGLEELTEVNSKHLFLIVAPSSTNFEENLTLLKRVKKIQLLNINMKIGLFFSGIISIDDMTKMLQWCWKHRIVNIFITFASKHSRPHSQPSDHNSNIFRLNMFETRKVENVSGFDWLNRVFYPANVNFHQYPLRVIDSFLESDQKVWQSVLHVLNASTVSIAEHIKYVYHTKSQIYDIDLGIDIDARADFFEPDLSYLYPMFTLTIVLVVPEALPYTTFTNYLVAITADQFFVFSAITILASVLALTCIRYVNKRKIKIFQSAADVLNVLLVHDNAYIKYERLSNAEVFVVGSLTLSGFFVVNVFLSAFQSHLTRPYKGPEINTFEDVYRSPFPIVVPDFRYRDGVVNRLQNLLESVDWTEKVHIIGYDYYDDILTNNVSMIFSLEEMRAKHLVRIQHQFNIQGHRVLPEIYLQKLAASYNLCDDYPFIDRLNGILHRIHSAGLHQKWLDDDLQVWLRSVLLLNRNVASDDAEVDISTISLGNTIIYGWICAFVVFVIEVLWKKMKVLNKAAGNAHFSRSCGNAHGAVEPLGLFCPYER